MIKLCVIESRHGRPGSLLSVGHAEGKFLYLEVATSPVVQVVALERDDVLELRAALDAWLRENEEREPSNVVPLVAGAIGRGRIDAATVQFRTVAPAHAPEQRERDGLLSERLFGARGDV
jgi:hypothetical protein